MSEAPRSLTHLKALESESIEIETTAVVPAA